MKCGRFETLSFASCCRDRGSSTSYSLPVSGTKEGVGADANAMTVDASSIPTLDYEKA